MFCLSYKRRKTSAMLPPTLVFDIKKREEEEDEEEEKKEKEKEGVNGSEEVVCERLEAGSG